MDYDLWKMTPPDEWTGGDAYQVFDAAVFSQELWDLALEMSLENIKTSRKGREEHVQRTLDSSL